MTLSMAALKWGRMVPEVHMKWLIHFTSQESRN